MLDPSNAIRNLLYLYTERFDLGDLSGAAELFRHARIITGEQGDSIDAEALLALWKKHVILYQETGTPRTKHQCTNAIVELDEGGLTASARSYYVVYQQTDTLPLQPIVAGRYLDRFECVDGEWRFSERDYRLMEMLGNTSQHLHGSITDRK